MEKIEQIMGRWAAQNQIRQTGQPCQPTIGDDVVVVPLKKELPKDPALYGIPKRYAHIDLGYIKAKGVPEQAKANVAIVEDFIIHIQERLDSGDGLLMRGGVGTMKTTLAVAIMKAAIEKKNQAFFIPMANMMDNLMQLEGNEKRAFEKKLVEVPLLVIDDLGMEYEKGYAQVKIRAIINDRYNKMKSTIVTTNLGKDIQDRYIEGMLDRIKATSTFLNFTGKSLRG